MGAMPDKFGIAGFRRLCGRQLFTAYQQAKQAAPATAVRPRGIPPSPANPAGKRVPGREEYAAGNTPEKRKESVPAG